MAKLSIIVALLIVFSFPATEVFSQRAESSSHTIDFANFHGSIGLFRAVEYPTRSFTLRAGKFGDWQKGMTLRRVVYGDVTGDGIDEAIVTLAVNTAGSAAVDHVYIFTLRDNRPRFLWGFEGGDRAWGGLRQAYTENGELVVELFGRGTHIGGDLGSTEPVGLCCPQSMTRARYRWHAGRFHRYAGLEILPNPGAKTNCPTCLPDS
jgi:hypothetical protein